MTNMPFTVVTLKNVPPSLRGDLTKWMQEIATGVYVGNFNTRIREELWERIQENVGKGEATISYAYRNEIGYQFETLNAQRQKIFFDGIPLVLSLSEKKVSNDSNKFGYSDAAKFRRIKKFSGRVPNSTVQTKVPKSTVHYVVIDIETDGLDEQINNIIEIGAIKVMENGVEEFESLISYEGRLPVNISRLTGISQEQLDSSGRDIIDVFTEFLEFIGDADLVGYSINFDLKFINEYLNKMGYPLLKNKTHDLMRCVKNEKMFLENYQLQTVLKEYGIEGQVPHRALQDSRLIYELSTKVNKFMSKLKSK